MGPLDMWCAIFEGGLTFPLTGAMKSPVQVKDEGQNGWSDVSGIWASDGSAAHEQVRTWYSLQDANSGDPSTDINYLWLTGIRCILDEH